MSERPEAAYNISRREESRMTYSHLLPGYDQTKPRYTSGISPSNNIGRSFSPVSIHQGEAPCLSPKLYRRKVQEVGDLKDQESIKSGQMGDSASYFVFGLRPEHDEFGIDWDEKLAEAGYGQDVVSQDLFSLSEASSLPPVVTEDSVHLDTLTFDPSNILYQDLEKEEGSTMSLPVYDKSQETKEKQFHFRHSVVQDSEDNIKQVMRTSGNILELMRQKKKDLPDTVDWDKVRRSRETAPYLSRELGFLEISHLLLIRDVTMMTSCVKNDDGTKDLLLLGSELQKKVGRRLRDEDLFKVIDFVSSDRKIVYLDLSYNQITSEGFSIITDFLSKNDTLRGVNLMWNNIEFISSENVINLASNRSLKSLRINGNFIGRKGGEFMSFIIMYSSLDHLDISQTDQTIQTLPWLVQAILQSDLKRLDASRILGRNLYGDYNKHLSFVFGDLLKMSFLVELHIQKNAINDHDVVQLMDGFWKNKTLEMLDLSCNRIGDYGVEIIAKNINFGAPLQALMLSNNQIRDAGARFLSRKLPFSQIKLLDLSKNQIKQTGIDDIVQTVQKPFYLLALFIFGNEITDGRVIKMQIDNGNLLQDSIDVRISYLGDLIQCSYNPGADRYRNRYYRVPRYGVPQDMLKREKKIRCRQGCLNFMYHNLVNLRPDLQLRIKPRDLEPYNIGGSCLI